MEFVTCGAIDQLAVNWRDYRCGDDSGTGYFLNP